MKIEKTNFDGLLIIQPDVFEDSRGLFFESFNKEKYEKGGIADKFVQDNISSSCQNTVRGLHFQIGEKAQGKLCQVIFGSVLDVAVDVQALTHQLSENIFQLNYLMKITCSYGFLKDLHMAFWSSLKEQYFHINVQSFTIKKANDLFYLTIRT